MNTPGLLSCLSPVNDSTTFFACWSALSMYIVAKLVIKPAITVCGGGIERGILVIILMSIRKYFYA